MVDFLHIRSNPVAITARLSCPRFCLCLCLRMKMHINKAHSSTVQLSNGSPWRDLITLI